MVDCAPLVVTFTNASSGGVSYVWGFGDGNSNTSVDPTNSFSNNTQFIEVYDVDLIVLSANSCTDTSTQSITVYPELDITFTAFPDSGCSPLEVTFPPAVGAVGWDWDFDDGGVTSSQQTPTHTFVNSTTNDENHSIRLVASSPFGCVDTSYQNVLVKPKPSAGISVDINSGCHPLQVEYTNSSTGGLDFLWNFGDNNTSNSVSVLVQHIFSNTSSASIDYGTELIVSTTDGCSDTADLSVTVFPEIISEFFANDTAGCHPLEISFVEQTKGADTLKWGFGNGFFSSNNSEIVTYSNSSNANVDNLTVELVAVSQFGCSDTVDQEILVYPKPLAQFVAFPVLGCQPLTSSFTNSSTVGSTYSWVLGDGTTSTTTAISFDHTYTNTGLVTVDNDLELIVENAFTCSDTAVEQITVHPQIIADFTVDTFGCRPFTVDFTDNSIGVQTYAWDFNDGSSSIDDEPSHVFDNTFTVNFVYDVQVTVTSNEGCTDFYNQEVLIFPKPTANFSFDTDTSCHPLTTDIFDDAVIPDFYSWDLGDGTTLTTSGMFSHTFVNTGSNPVTYAVSLQVTTTNGCTDEETREVLVYPQIIADFSSDTAGCHPYLVSFNDNSTGVEYYAWDFKDGNVSTDNEPSNTFKNTSLVDEIFQVQLTVTSTERCTDIDTQMITVHPKPIADFNSDVSAGCHPLDVEITDNSSIANLYAWNLGDGATSTTTGIITHTYQNTGANSIFNNVSLLVSTTNGCIDTVVKSIEIYPVVVATFSPSLSGCDPLEVPFNSSSTNSDSYEWTFADGTTSTDEHPVHTYVNSSVNDSIFTPQLIVASNLGCKDTVTGSIEVFPSPKTDFSATPVSQRFPESTVSFQNNTNQGPFSFSWELGDNTNEDVDVPADHTYATWGVYSASVLGFSDKCRDSIVKQVEILPPFPIAEFDGSAVGCTPLEVEFINESTYGVSYVWTFGDGSSSIEENPIHTYFQAGDYNVKLIAIPSNI